MSLEGCRQHRPKIEEVFYRLFVELILVDRVSRNRENRMEVQEPQRYAIFNLFGVRNAVGK
jgi:hypothetical protein